MHEQRRIYSIKLMSESLSITRSGYYRWISTGMISPKFLTETDLLNQILEIFYNSKQRYGSPRITAELRSKGMRISKKRVARIMKKHGIKSKTKRRFKVTTNSKHKLPVAKNLVEMKFNPEKANNLWTSDITYIRTSEGWLYLAVVLDLWSRSVISWGADKYMDENLVIRTLDKAIAIRGKQENLIFHSDRGSQFASLRVRKLLEENQIRQSMSSKGNCYDNAPTESFFSTLKRELVYRENFKTREEAKQKLFEYIEVFYNRKRRHSSLGYLSPLDFEKQNINLINLS
jgi:transposase InsO family protein